MRVPWPTAPSGIYTIATGGTPYRVLCDMATDGGGWTLVMNASSVSRLLVIDQYVDKSLLVTQPAVDTGKVELLDRVTTGASLAWGHLAGQDTLFVAAPTRVAKAPGTLPWALFNAMDTGFKTFGAGYGGFHSECGSPNGWKIRNFAQYGNLDSAKLVMLAGSYDGSMLFMHYGVSSSLCFSNLSTWGFEDYEGSTSDEVVNVFTR